jgi:hypothetical protein
MCNIILALRFFQAPRGLLHASPKLRRQTDLRQINPAWKAGAITIGDGARTKERTDGREK